MNALLRSFVLVGLVACGRPPADPPRTAPAPATPPAPAAMPVHAALEPQCAAAGPLLSALKQPMTAVLYVTPGDPAHDRVDSAARSILAAWASVAAGKLSVRVVEVKTEAQKSAARAAGAFESPDGFRGLELSYGATTSSTSILGNSLTGLEYTMLAHARRVVLGDAHRHDDIGVLTGHDELKLGDESLVPGGAGTPTLEQVLTKNFPNLAFAPVDLRHEDHAATTAMAGLLITQPATDLTDVELRRIDELVLAGKPVVIVASAVNLRAADPALKATIGTHGLEKLLAGYGVTMQQDVVADHGASVVVRRLGQTSTVATPFPQFPLVGAARGADGQRGLESDVPFFARIETLAMPFSSSLSLDPSKAPDASLRVVARSSPTTELVHGKTVDLGAKRAWKAPKSGTRANLAVLVEGTLRSAFDATKKSQKTARLLVIASSQLFANPFARVANGRAPSLQMQPAPVEDLMATNALPYAQEHLTALVLAANGAFEWMALPADLQRCVSLESR